MIYRCPNSLRSFLSLAIFFVESWIISRFDGTRVFCISVSWLNAQAFRRVGGQGSGIETLTGVRWVETHHQRAHTHAISYAATYTALACELGIVLALDYYVITVGPPGRNCPIEPVLLPFNVSACRLFIVARSRPFLHTDLRLACLYFSHPRIVARFPR